MAYNTRNAADSAARREMRKIYGASYCAKAGVDFHVYRKSASFDWAFEIINEAAHRANA